jgi:2-keto-3-deoxy-L-rhamnonate aldolase RhmA
MRNNHTLDLLRHGKPALGTWLQMQSIREARLIAAQGCLDWVVIDCEHAAFDYSTVSAIMNAVIDVSGGRVTPIARVGAGTIDQIKQTLDCGAQAVLVPMVNNPVDAANVVRFARFPPQGERGSGSSTVHLSFGATKADYMANANKEILVAIQIETPQAVENIESILDVPGIDMVFIGPNDLTLSLGLQVGFWSDSPLFLDSVQAVITACRRRNIAYGTLSADAKSARQRKEEGFTFVGISTDCALLLNMIGQTYGEFNGISEPPEGWVNLLKMD